MPGRVIEHAAVQRDVLAAGDDLQRVELQVLHRAHGLLRALDAAPAPPGPQALLAEDEATGGVEVDGQHTVLLRKINGKPQEGRLRNSLRNRVKSVSPGDCP